MVELLKRLLNTLYMWIASHYGLNGFTYEDFLNLFSARSFEGHSCILIVYYDYAFLCFINELTLLFFFKKKTMFT
jgi:hypothetical protein